VTVRCIGQPVSPPEPGGVAVGFNNNSVTDGVATPAEAASLLSAVGADIDRVQINWSDIEPAPGQYRFSTFDAIYQADLAQGIRPVFIFAYAPLWASGTACMTTVGCHAPPTPDHYGDAAEAAAAIAARYPKAAGIEIWNEPNTPYYWQPSPDPAAYTALLAACHDAIKAVEPNMPVAGGVTASGVGGSPGKIRATWFLSEMYNDGAKGFMDAISMHAYPDPDAASTVAAVNAVKAVRDQYGDSSIPIWVTEIGATTTGSSSVSEDRQAALLSGADEALRATPDVEMVLFHTLIEPNRGATNSETGYGIVTDDLRKKPAYCALGSDWSRPQAC
jgi:hypothetical protein